MDRDLFRDVIGHFASGVTIITARHKETNFGITASAVCSLSLDPPMLLVCVNKKTGTRHAIAESKAFAVNILHEDQGELAARFARPNTDKYRGVEIVYGELGEPLLKDALAHLECRVVEEVTAGTHSVFLAEVQNAWAKEGTPLTYFRGKFGRFQEASDERVYREIRQLVLERDVPAGQSITINDLAYQLDAPRQAVYYAMTRLEAEGLVTREEEGRYVVSPLDSETLNGALDTRCALEVGAAEKAVGRISNEELAELRRRMEATLFSGEGRPVSAERYVEANAAFHEYTVALANNPTLLETYRQLTAEAVMSSALRAALEADDEFAGEQLKTLAEDHVRLTEAFEAGDLEEAKRVVRRHTEAAKRLGRYLMDSAGGSL
ncbi:flavin reductase [Rubrobacter xylanophilus]|uniref:flavin reductase n=1 Tax=Rubrobacter xylanophilus TaxID=49319 RepID=UPI0018DC1B95|nr:flavin reductase [Rubrobacter xylanophilus]